jgi:predicted RNase H-like HicB family nuclease
MKFDVVIRKDEDGYYVATVPDLAGCHAQARCLDELMSRIKEAILLCLDVKERDEMSSFVGVQIV